MASRIDTLTVVAASAALLIGGHPHPVSAATTEALTLERKIPLGDVSGRIDHFAIDLARQRLFVAELGNGTVGVLDLARGTVIHRLSGLKEPQGVDAKYSDGKITAMCGCSMRQMEKWGTTEKDHTLLAAVIRQKAVAADERTKAQDLGKLWAMASASCRKD